MASLYDLREQPYQLRALGGCEGREELRVRAIEQRIEAHLAPPPRRRQLHHLAPGVARVALPPHEAQLLQAGEDGDHVAPVYGESAHERGLRLAPALREASQHDVVEQAELVRREPRAAPGAPPLEPPGYRKTETGFVVDYPPPLDRGYALAETVAGIAALLRAQRAEAARVRLVRSVAELRQARSDGALAAVLHLADADSIDEELDALLLLHEAGVRSIAVTWSRPNAFGYGAPYRSPASPDIGPGLTAAGIRLVRACNELGIMIDLAHLNEAGFMDVARDST